MPGSASAGAPDVAALQLALRIRGTYGGGIDGIFGPETQAAVRRFQRGERLIVDGVAGAATIGGLRRALGCRELKRTVPPEVTVSGVGIGGLSAHWASIALRSGFAEPLHLAAHGRGWLVDPNQFARAEVAAAVRRALRTRMGEDFLLRVAVQRRRKRGGLALSARAHRHARHHRAGLAATCK